MKAKSEGKEIRLKPRRKKNPPRIIKDPENPEGEILDFNQE